MSNNGVDMKSIHHPDKSLERIMKKIEAFEIPENKKILKEFYEECFSNDLSPTRVLFYMERLSRLSKMIKKDFSSLTKEDIKRIVGEINKNNGWSEWTKHDFKVALRKLYQWLDGYEWDSGEFPDRVKWIKTTVRKDRETKPIILTLEEVKDLIKATTNERDKALISLLYESGCRIGEILNMRIKDVVFDKYGIRIRVFGKTGERYVRIIASFRNLNDWLNKHPNRIDKESPLWTCIGTRNKFNRIDYQVVRKILEQLKEKIGLKKRLHPHLFRHTRATHLASELKEPEQMVFFGWRTSAMTRLYNHLNGGDIDRKMLRIYGKLPEEGKKENEYKQKICPRCGNENPPEEDDFCEKCNFPLSQKGITELQKAETNVLNTITNEQIDEMIRNRVNEILKEKGLEKQI